MKKVMKLIITIAIIIALVIGIYYITRTVTAITGKGIVGWVGKIFKLSLSLN